MKKTLFLYITISFCFVLSVSSQEYQNWKWLYPLPQGNHLTWVKLWDDNLCYAFGEGGTFMKSSNRGSNWFFHHKASNVVTADSSSTNIFSAYFFDQLTGYASGDGGVTKTTNGGVTFENVPFFSPTRTWNDVYFVNQNTGFVLGDLTGSLCKTTDGGNTWNFIFGTPTYGRKVFSPDGNTILVLANEHTSIGSNGVVYKSTNSGSTWNASFLTRVNIFEMDFCNDSTGVVGGFSLLFLTTNTGINWTELSTPTENIHAIKIYQDADSVRIYLAGPSNGIYYSNNYGSNWIFKQYNDPLQTFSPRYYDLSKFNNTIMTVGYLGLINRSTNLGANWNNLNYLPNDGAFYGVFAESGNGRVWVVGTGSSSLDSGQILFSSNGGSNWIRQYTHPTSINNIKMVNLNTGYATARNSLLKTTNSGANWSSVTIPGFTNIKNLDFNNPLTGWVVNPGKLSKTTDGSLTWTSVNLTGGSISSFVEFTDDLTGWIIDYSVLRYTSNGGQNWTIQASITNGFKAIRMFNNQEGYVLSNYNLKKTTNSGSVWIDIPVPAPQRLTYMSWSDMNNGILCGINGYTMKTMDGGQSWQILNTNSSENYIFGIIMNHPDSAFAVGGFSNSCIFKYTSSITNVLSWEYNIPENFSLLQNYPNPFNPNTTIEFDLKSKSNVSLKVYDIAGRLVHTIVDGMEFNSGRVKYDFNGSNLSSGVYFYTLFIDNKGIETKKMLLVK